MLDKGKLSGDGKNEYLEDIIKDAKQICEDIGDDCAGFTDYH